MGGKRGRSGVCASGSAAGSAAATWPGWRVPKPTGWAIDSRIAGEDRGFDARFRRFRFRFPVAGLLFRVVPDKPRCS